MLPRNVTCNVILWRRVVKSLETLNDHDDCVIIDY